jgi:predicted RNA binding protein YcfA (HicA-like mRNA interferase family)
LASLDGLRYACIAKVGDVLDKLREDGWFLVVTKGSHRQFKHPTKPGRVTVAGKPSDDLPPGTLDSIFKQAGWKKGAN